MDVICLGLMVCDIMAGPVCKEALQKDVSLVDYVAMRNGGDAMNVAINLAAMGVSTRLAGKIGRDRFGDFLLEAAAQKGLDTSGVLIEDNSSTAICITLIGQNGERNFIYYSGAGANLCEADIDISCFKGAKILSVSGAGLLPSFDGKGLAAILEKTQEMGIKTCMDISGDLDDTFRDKAGLMLQYTDIFVPSDYQARVLTGMEKPEDMAIKLLETGPEIVAIKLGSKGSLISTKNHRINIPAFKMEAVDTTGAGDAFVAGFLAAYLKGWDLYRCGRFANAAGALCVAGLGATSGARPLDEILEFMQKH